MNDAEIQREIERIYRDVPPINCKGLCQECCGPIGFTHIEHERMQAAANRPIEALEIPCGGFVSGQSLGRAMFLIHDSCPLLKDGRCTIYNARPLICRIWGSVQQMRCPYGCTPKRWLSPRESYRLLDRMRNLSAKIMRHETKPKQKEKTP